MSREFQKAQQKIPFKGKQARSGGNGRHQRWLKFEYRDCGVGGEGWHETCAYCKGSDSQEGSGGKEFYLMRMSFPFDDPYLQDILKDSHGLKFWEV